MHCMSPHVEFIYITVVSLDFFVASGTLKILLVLQQLSDLILELCWHIKVNSARVNVDAWGYLDTWALFLLLFWIYFSWVSDGKLVIIPELSDQPDERGQVGRFHVVGGRSPYGERVGREVILVVPFTLIRIWGSGGKKAAKEHGWSLLIICQQVGADWESHPDGVKNYINSESFLNKKLFTWF